MSFLLHQVVCNVNQVWCNKAASKLIVARDLTTKGTKSGKITLKMHRPFGALNWNKALFLNHEFYNITPNLILGKHCASILIDSTSNSSFWAELDDGWYEKNVFTSYSLRNLDKRGNGVYHARISGKDRYIHKTKRGNWLVSFIPIRCCMKHEHCHLWLPCAKFMIKRKE